MPLRSRHLRPAAFSCILVALMLIVGCRRPFSVFTEVCARVADPVQVETLSPIKVETAPLNVTAELAPVKKEPLREVVVRDNCSGTGARVVIVDVDGLLVNENHGSPIAVPENPVSLFREKLNHVAEDPLAKAIVLRINSPGGGVTACDIMRRDLQQFREAHNIPVIACLMDVGAGGAYYLATAADEVHAHPTSLVGGIGVILNLYQLELETFNVVSVAVKAGKKVDMGTPMREMPDEVRALLQEIADDFHERFIQIVRSARKDVDDEDDVFDGRICTALVAKEKGLVDEIGYFDDAIERAAQLAGTPNAGVVLLDRQSNTAKTSLDILGTVGQELNLLGSIPGLDRSKLPTFLYIWQPDPSLTAKIGG